MTTDLLNTPVSHCPLTTKRMMIAQVSLCRGCCCGNVERGKPEVPVDRMKHEWRTRGLSKFVQLSISGCLGPCDVVNVVRISGVEADVWLGELRSIEDYLEIVNWAQESKAAGKATPLSNRMKQKRFSPFRRSEHTATGSVPQSIQKEEGEL